MLIVGDFNFHFDCSTNSNTERIMNMLQSFRSSKAVCVLIAVDTPLTLWFNGGKILFFAQYQSAIVCLLIICL